MYTFCKCTLLLLRVLTPTAMKYSKGGELRKDQRTEGMCAAGKVKVRRFGPTTTTFIMPIWSLQGIIRTTRSHGHAVHLAASDTTGG